MLEIVILIILGGKIGKIVEKKGRTKIGYQLMLVGLWVGGEVFGLIVGSVLSAVLGDGEGAGMLLVVALGLGCAITGAIIAFQIAKNVPPLDADDEFYRGIEYADSQGVRERFGDRLASPPATDAITDDAESAPRPHDERIQE
jgi:hypothetical protein